MFIQNDQLHEILSPKLGCQRGLEEYIVNVHDGDKQKQHPRGSLNPAKNGYEHDYGYINNPVYRVGIEGDPGPESYSSRHLQEHLEVNESALHLLTNTIDSGSVLQGPIHWNQNWAYDRGDIPNITILQDSDDDIKGKIINQQELTQLYDEKVDLRYLDYQIDGINTRYLPIYDRAHISNDEEPDGIHEHPTHDRYYGIGIRKPIPKYGIQNMQLIEGFENDDQRNGEPKVTANSVKLLKAEKQKKIEGYQKVDLSNRRGLGKYGNPVPDGYGRLGDSPYHYEVIRNSAFTGINSATYLVPTKDIDIIENYQPSKPFNITPKTTFRQLNSGTNLLHKNSNSYLILWISIAAMSVLMLAMAQKYSK